MESRPPSRSVGERDVSGANQGNPAAPPNRNAARQQCSRRPLYSGNRTWQDITQTYFEALAKGGIKRLTIEEELWGVESPSAFLTQVSNSQPPGRAISPDLLRRLELVLHSLSNFATVAALAIGAKSEVSTIVWGSIGLILKVSYTDTSMSEEHSLTRDFKFAGPIIPKAISLLEELHKTLPRYKKQDQDVALNGTLKEAVSDFYTEILLFLAQAIVFFRNNPDAGVNPAEPLEFVPEISKVINKLRKISKRVDEEADVIRIKRETHPTEAMPVVPESAGMRTDGSPRLPCHMIPDGLNPRFLGRSEELYEVTNALEPQVEANMPRILGIHGLGGVGKTQLALHYANSSLHLYDIILWVPAKTQVEVLRAMSMFTKKLGMSAEVDDRENNKNNQLAQKLKDWLNLSGNRFLLIFDDVDALDALLPVWPASGNGSIIMTTRCPSIAMGRATKTICLEPFSRENSLETLTSFTGIKPTDGDELDAAGSICNLLGDLPLGIAQVSQYITCRGFSYEEFLSLYRHSYPHVHTRGTISGYAYNLSTVWDLSLQQLPGNARFLQGFLCFFDPDGVPEKFFTGMETVLNTPPFKGLTDELAFGDAVGALMRTSLIKRSPRTRSISTHILVQATKFSRLPISDVQFLFDSAITLLSNAFPNTWKDTGDQQGHQWASWESCGEVLPHVSWLVELSKKHNLKPSQPELFAELNFRLGTYLWEREQPTKAQGFIEFGLSLDVDREGPLCNPALRLLGHIALDMARPDDALKPYFEALMLRLQLEKADTPAIADVYDSIACAYTEMGSVPKAFQYIDEATKIHEAHDPGAMARTYAILAVAHLRAGHPEQALDALTNCWNIQGLTEEEVAESDYPKHSGDIVLLSRIQYDLGKKESAIQLAYKSIDIRKKTFGDKSPRVADSMYTVAGMLRDNGRLGPAMKLLREIIHVCNPEDVEMRGHLARALWMLAWWEEDLGNTSEAGYLKVKAREVKREIMGTEKGEEEDEDGAFFRLVSYMLW
ncbi:hypothetical protein FQN54_009159 [Arachnomyces sp. PD_36]|nr:hypothetical protein FQN54_009159 [Arachnomyces sp. PD_36]